MKVENFAAAMASENFAAAIAARYKEQGWDSVTDTLPDGITKMVSLFVGNQHADTRCTAARAERLIAHLVRDRSLDPTHVYFANSGGAVLTHYREAKMDGPCKLAERSIWKRLKKPPKVLTVMSHTHYGRGTPLSGTQERFNIRLARHVLDLLAPGLPTYGYCDEDYGWMVPLTDEQVAALRARYPESLDDCGILYLSNGGKYQDMLYLDFEGKKVSIQAAIDTPFWTDMLVLKGPVVDRDHLFEDWYDNFGGHG